MLQKTNSPTGQARLLYLDNEIEIISLGDHVVCAVTGRKIPLAALRYWSVDLQEPYYDAAAAAVRLVGRTQS